MKKFLNEFKGFALRGNVMSMAVGVIVGSAFQGVITSLTDNLLSPILGLFIRQNFDSLELNFLGVTLRYGAFITTVINFIILALIVFIMIRGMNRLLAVGERKKEEPIPDRLCPYCMSKLHPKATRCPACTSELCDEEEEILH